MDLAAFTTLPPDAAADAVRPVCASDAWVDAVVAGRPYADLAALGERSDELVETMPWTAVEQALSSHPRIGERPAGADREASWSRDEQAGVSDADAFRRGNVEYEQRFGHVFLICATGRSGAEMLAALEQRLTHDEATERKVVRSELAAIARLRLAKVFES